jgi:coenzyme F420-0:L-glutamate ligase/coenzyme F420-1:gamma-L-glutamate ligase
VTAEMPDAARTPPAPRAPKTRQAPASLGIPEPILARRSVRAFAADPVPDGVVDAFVEAACLAPAPHHSRPWRFVALRTPAAKRALATGMGDAWRADLAADGVPAGEIDRLVDASHARIEGAPLVLLGCLTWDGLDRYPDERRQRAEHGMALLSLGAAVQNLMLTATALGYASCWVAAPIFCPEAARDALGLPGEWLPHAMVLAGRPHPDYAPPARPPVDLTALGLRM